MHNKSYHRPIRRLVACLVLLHLSHIAFAICLHDNDSILMYRVSCPSDIASGSQALWNYGDLSIIDEPEYARIIPQSEGVYTYRMQRSLYRARLTSDSVVSLLGIENSLFNADFTMPDALFGLPIHYHDSMQSEYDIHGEYGHTLSYQAHCKSISRVIGIGTLSLPEGVVDSVACVHISRTMSRKQNNVPFIRNDIYLWMPQSSLSPLMSVETYSDTIHTIWSGAFIYPDAHLARPDVRQISIDSMNTTETEDTILSGASFMPNPVVNDLQIKYMLGRSAQVYYSIHYNDGTLAFSTPIHFEQAGEHSINISMSMLPSSSYVVYIHADNAVCSGVVIKL